MPTYEYECLHCGHRFEALQKITDQPLSRCPKCNHKVKRLISSGSGIIFKGSGFYATDYRKKPRPTPTADKNISCPQKKEGCSGCDKP